jgi:hypothetical protein
MVASVAPAPVRESLAAALHRLAQKAHAEGCHILDDGFAPYACRVSSSRAGEAPYIVNLAPGRLHGCGCAGYQRYQRCKHYSLALEAAGWLPAPPDDPPPGAPAPISALPRAERRELAAADLAARYPSLHPARSEDLAAA